MPFLYYSVTRNSNLNTQPYSISGISFKQCTEIIYADPDLANKRDIIPSENKGKTGVYAWVNIIYNKLCIGSVDLIYVRTIFKKSILYP